MGILFKFVVTSIKESKFRTFLILLSISLSVGLFFASMAISKTVEDMIVEQVKIYIGTAEFAVYGSESWFFKEKDIESIKEQYEYVIGLSEGPMSYKDKDQKLVNINMTGIELEDLQIMNPYTLVDEEAIEPWVGKIIIIGEAYAEEKVIKLGDNIKINDNNGFKHMFKVAGIAESKGFFKQSMDSNRVKFITPKDTMAKIYGSKGKVSQLYVRTNGTTTMDEAMDSIKTIYTKHDVYEMISQEEIDQMSSQVRIPFLFMMILVGFISIFIIYTSFKVIMMERLPMLGTFRSIGATKKMTNFIMLAETIVYGIFGGIIGVFLGIGVLTIMVQVIIAMMGEWMDVMPRVVYGIDDVLFAFGGAMFLSVISAVIPIVKASRLPIKEILLNLMEGTKKKKKYTRLIIAIVLGIISVSILVFVKGTTGAKLGVVSIILMITSCILIVPYATYWIIGITEGLFGKLFGNIGILAVKNIRSDKSYINNAILLTIGLSSIVTIAAMSDTTKASILSGYSNMNFDIDGYISNASATTIQRVKSIDGVDDCFKYNYYSGFKYGTEDNSMIKNIRIFSDPKAYNYYKVDILDTDDDKAIFEELFKGRNLVVSTMIKKKYDLDVGQEVELRFDKNEKELKAKYKILGFINPEGLSTSLAIGSTRIIGIDLGKMNSAKYGIIISEGYDPEEVSTKIKEATERYGYSDFNTVENRKKQELRDNGMIIALLGGFAMITMLIGSIGVMNNYLVSFHSRKRSLAVFASVGMSKKQTVSMIMIEAVSGGLLGGVFGIITGFGIITMLSSIMAKADMAMPLYLMPLNIVIGLLSAVVVSVLSSISPARKTSKLSIVAELKYE